MYTKCVPTMTQFVCRAKYLHKYVRAKKYNNNMTEVHLWHELTYYHNKIKTDTSRLTLHWSGISSTELEDITEI